MQHTLYSMMTFCSESPVMISSYKANSFLYDNKEEWIIYTYILFKVHILIWIIQSNISFWNNFTFRKNFKNSTKFPASLHINKYQMHSTMSKSKKLTENNWLICRPYWNFNNCLVHVLFLNHELIFSYPVLSLFSFGTIPVFICFAWPWHF